MTKRRLAALVYICAVLLWGGACALYVRSPELNDLGIAIVVVIGSLGLATLTYPLGLFGALLGRLAADMGVDGLDTWFALFTLPAALVGYWQWFHFFPRLYSGVARRRQAIRDLANAERRRSHLDRVIGMKRSRAVFLYISVVLIVGLGSFGLNMLPAYWREFNLWLLENDSFGLIIAFIQNLTMIGLAGLALLTFPAGALFVAVIVLPLVFMGVATPNDALFLTTPLAALVGAVQWFWLLPKLYRQKTGIADAF